MLAFVAQQTAKAAEKSLNPEAQAVKDHLLYGVLPKTILLIFAFLAFVLTFHIFGFAKQRDNMGGQEFQHKMPGMILLIVFGVAFIVIGLLLGAEMLSFSYNEIQGG